MSHSSYEVIIYAGSANQTILMHFGPTGCDTHGCNPVSPPKHVIEKQSTNKKKAGITIDMILPLNSY